MNKSKVIRKEYPKVRELQREKKGETYTFYRVDCRGRGWKGKQQPEFQKKSEALEHASDVAGKLITQEGNVSVETIRLIDRVQKKLLPYNVELEAAVDSFIERHIATVAMKNTETMNNVTAWYLESKKSGLKKIRPETLRGIAMTCNKLRSTFGDVPIGSITTETVESALEDMGTKNTTKKDYLNRFRTFFKWCIKSKYIKDNPCSKDIEVYGDDKDETMILSNDDVVTLLGNLLEEPKLIPYITLCLFAGIRPTECTKVKWENIWLDERKTIHLPKSITKTIERNTPIYPVLEEWLAPYVGKPIKITNQRKTIDRVKGKIPWQKDILRHTAISHFMEKEKNIYVVSEHLGNSPDVIKKHYQRRLLKLDNEFFWSLTPTKVREILEERKKKGK